MFHSIKKFVHRVKYNKRCKFGRNTNIDNNCVFEGSNRIGKNSSFLSSNIGYASYISDNSFIKNSIIGKYTSIAGGVKTVVGKHPTNYISTHPAFYSVYNESGISYVSQNNFVENTFISEEKKCHLY